MLIITHGVRVIMMHTQTETNIIYSCGALLTCVLFHARMRPASNSPSPRKSSRPLHSGLGDANVHPGRAAREDQDSTTHDSAEYDPKLLPVIVTYVMFSVAFALDDEGTVSKEDADSTTPGAPGSVVTPPLLVDQGMLPNWDKLATMLEGPAKAAGRSREEGARRQDAAPPRPRS